MPDRPIRNELIALARRDPEAIADLVFALFDRIEKLESEVAELKRNSRNSSKPPSSDRGIGPQKPTREKGKKRRRPGGQRGHEGHTLEKVKDPDHIVSHELSGSCQHCGAGLEATSAHAYEARQVFDLPKEIKIEVTEHRAAVGTCHCCGARAKAAFPDEVRAPVQYGERVQALVIYLHVYQLLPCERLSELCQDLFGFPMSPGTVANFVKKCGDRAGPVAESIKCRIQKSGFIHCDETGMNLFGKNHWLHVTSTPELAYFHVNSSRGRKALDEIGILEDYTGFVVHDYYSSYYHFEGCAHVLCNAHHLRDLTYIEEELGQKWAGKMIDWLLKAKNLKDHERAGGRRIGPKTLKRLQREYESILRSGYRVNPEPEKKPGQKGRTRRGKALNLLDRFWYRHEEVTAFLYKDLPFDNNEAERDLRMMKTKQKISGCFRSASHAGAFAALRSIITTSKKKAVNILQILSSVIRDQIQAEKILFRS